MKWPLKFPLVTQDGGEETLDRFDNPVWTPGPPITVHVFAWEIVRSEEQTTGDNRGLLFEDLRIYALPDTFNYRNSVFTPDGQEWLFNGAAEDNRHNPYFDPGMVTYHAIKRGESEQ